jgi:hypothetical protein
MRLDLLLRREDFPHIFSKLLDQELSKRFGWSGQIIWEQSRCLSTTDKLLVNQKLNVIYPATMSRRVLRQFTAEYRYHPNLFRRLFQSLFVRFATSFPFEMLTTVAVVKISPWLDKLEHFCVIPGNHSIRIVELDHDRCRVFIKPGFNYKFIRNEITIRTQFSFLPIPNLLDSNKDDGWYLEERIIALPLNRIADQKLRKEMLLQAHNALLELYATTRQVQRLSERREQLISSLRKAVNLLPVVYTRTERNQIYFLINKLDEQLADSGVQLVDTVQSHGDFQPANILIATEGGTKQLYLIDWEYSERRTQFYDALVFAVQARFPFGLALRFKKLMSGEHQNFSWCGYSSLTEWMVVLFLMEDLLVRLEEMNIPELKQKSEGLSQWMREVEKMQWLSNR